MLGARAGQTVALKQNFSNYMKSGPTNFEGSTFKNFDSSEGLGVERGPEPKFNLKPNLK